jgi:hypothetical protein
MLLHPVVVTATGNWPQDLVARLLPRWSQRLRVASRVLEFAKGPPSVGWAHAIRTLLQEQRIGELVREGFQVAPTIDVVWLAQSHAPELEAELEDLESQRDGPLFSGREVRIHVLLLLPSVFPIGQGEPARAQANIERLRPDRAAYPPLRVWPISLRNRADLHLRDANELAPLVQHFVEALICTDLPVHPTLGRDWAGVGLCRMAVARPARESIAARLASVLIKKSLAPVVVPSLPACPTNFPTGRWRTRGKSSGRVFANSTCEASPKLSATQSACSETRPSNTRCNRVSPQCAPYGNASSKNCRPHKHS